MRTSLTVVSAMLASIAIGFAAGCSGGSPSQTSMPPGAGAGYTNLASSIDLARSGRSPRAIALLRSGQPASRERKFTKKTGLKDLYVSGYVPADVLILENTDYKDAGSISKGLISPDGDFVDTSGNLYVTDYDGVDIQEYKPGGKSPSFTYNAGMTDPVNVSLDTHGNVYEADFDGYYVNEYAQKSNTVIDTCSPGGAVEGVAVDENNDVFVDYNLTPSGTGKIVEYKGGLAGCNATSLGVTLDFAGGMVLDAQGNLIVCDENKPAVDVIAPPYSAITGTLGSGFYISPFHVTLDKNNKLAFVADDYDVFVVDYPSGSLAATLGSANGITFPAGAVDAENAVY
jgi:hypothetical protein